MDIGDPNQARLVGDYILGPRIGSGSFAVVWKARHRQLGLEVAVKEIDKKLLSPKVSENLLKEISILSTINHPNIIQLFEAIETKNKIYLVLEYCGGGDLSAYIHRHGRVSEAVARHFMRQLAAGLKVLQEKHLIHRDLKPQNLLLSTNEVTPLLKIGDFGFARSLTPQGLADTLCGSPLYMAPEIIQNQKYDAKADLWSVGAILFQLVTGKPPFDGNNQLQLFQNILTCTKLQFPEGALEELHPDCVDLCRSLLHRNPVERLIFKEFFNHKFLQEPGKTMDVEQASPPPQMKSMVEQSDSSTSEKTSLLHSEHKLNSFSRNPKSTNSSVHEDVFLNTKHFGVSSGTKGVHGLIPNIAFDKMRKSADAQCSSNQLGVVDSMELIENEYVLVNSHFPSMERLSYYLETSFKDNCTTRLSNCPPKKNDQGLAIAMETKEMMAARSPSIAENPQICASGPQATSSESTVLKEVQALTILHPSSRLHVLHQYVWALAELAQEKYNAGQLLEYFSVELVLLAIWKKALQICSSWMTSIEEGKSPGTSSAKESTIIQENRGFAPYLEDKIDFSNPSSACVWAEQGFIVAFDRAEKLSYHLRDKDADAEMPDAMEIIYQKALAFGRTGVADEYMENKGSAAALYSKAVLLFSFIVGEATTLPLNPPFSLTPDNKRQIQSFIINLQSRQSHSLMSQPFLSQSPNSLSK